MRFVINYIERLFGKFFQPEPNKVRVDNQNSKESLKITNPNEWDMVIEGRILTIHPTILEGPNDYTSISYFRDGDRTTLKFFGKIGGIDNIALRKSPFTFAERRRERYLDQRLLMPGYIGEVRDLPESQSKLLVERALDIIYSPSIIKGVSCRLV